jgi:hypothetical protein
MNEKSADNLVIDGDQFKVQGDPNKHVSKLKGTELFLLCEWSAKGYIKYQNIEQIIVQTKYDS